MSSIQIAEKKNERTPEKRIGESRTDCGGEINPTAPASKIRNNIIKCKKKKYKKNITRNAGKGKSNQMDKPKECGFNDHERVRRSERGRGSEDAVKVVGVRLETNNKSNNNNNNSRDAANGTAKKTGQSARRCNQAKRKKSGESEMASCRLLLGFLLTISYANHCSLKKQAKKKNIQQIILEKKLQTPKSTWLISKHHEKCSWSWWCEDDVDGSPKMSVR